MNEKIKSTVYVDEAGDLGVCRGTQWFVLTAVVVDKNDEKTIRNKLSAIKTRLNVQEIHLRKITDFYRRGFIVRELSTESFTYMNIIADTTKFDTGKISSPITAYNYLCRMLLERVSWFLRDTGREADVVLSARGTSKDNELIEYINEKLLDNNGINIAKGVINSVTAKSAGSWDLLQLADVCATTTFLAYEKNGWGFITPCFIRTLTDHLYTHNGTIRSYGIKFFTPEMKQTQEALKCNWACVSMCKKEERTPGATTT